MADFAWTEQAIAALADMWRAGKPATKIAAALGGGLTRNAVIGKCHRLKLDRGVVLSEPDPIEVADFAPALEKPEPVAIVAAPPSSLPVKKAVAPTRRVPRPTLPPPAPSTGLCTIVDLTEFRCCWPIGDPFDLESFRYCGDAKERSGPYCPRHSMEGSGRGTPSERIAVRVLARQSRLSFR